MAEQKIVLVWGSYEAFRRWASMMYRSEEHNSGEFHVENLRYINVNVSTQLIGLSADDMIRLHDWRSTLLFKIEGIDWMFNYMSREYIECHR